MTASGPTTTRPEDDAVVNDDVAEESPLATLPLIKRRRPAGGPERLPIDMGWMGWTWILGAFILSVIWFVLFEDGRPIGVAQRADAALLDAMVAVRSDGLTSAARTIALLGSVGLVLFLRWAPVLVLAVFQRGRTLVVFIGTLLVVRLAASTLTWVIQRPRPWDVPYLYGWEGYANPSTHVAAFAVAVVAAGHALVPAGRWRTRAMWCAAALVSLLALARVYLGVDHPSDVLVGAIGAVAVATIAFRLFVPDEIFPVRYDRGRAAHLAIDERRQEAIREALDEQAGLELITVEPFGEEGSGASTPLRLEVRRVDGGRVETLFGKLYSAGHLRADRWYKLSRTILYGELEDEVAFESVRRLVEYEDYMLRVMHEAGVRSVEPRGFVELEAEREYLLLMTFLERATEADQDAELSDAAIDDGLRIIRTLWDHGLAHRDIKPANVLVRGDHVFLIDVAFGQMRPTPWRQVVDLANMMLVLGLATTPERVYDRAVGIFDPDEIGEAFGAARGPAIPRQLREHLKEHAPDLIGRYRTLAPEHDTIAIQRWSMRRIVLTARTVIVAAAFLALLAFNLANPRAL
ncbi:MAG TPA: phosphatase PAP2 family protein [Actinomycetota bacterium]|nr:phosphatase PAP2 family protein [Actinomycetota bacterium]